MPDLDFKVPHTGVPPKEVSEKRSVFTPKAFDHKAQGGAALALGFAM